MWAARIADGYVFGGLTRYCVDTLRGVPMLLESTDPRVRERLLPETYGDGDDEVQWQRHAAPELERLFLSRAQLVRRDLDGMRQLVDADSWLLTIRDNHVNAWLASLNAARLALYELNDLEPRHMERDGLELASPKQQEALLRIHLLAEVQAVLLGDIVTDDEDPPADADDAE